MKGKVSSDEAWKRASEQGSAANAGGSIERNNDSVAGERAAPSRRRAVKRS